MNEESAWNSRYRSEDYSVDVDDLLYHNDADDIFKSLQDGEKFKKVFPNIYKKLHWKWPSALWLEGYKQYILMCSKFYFVILRRNFIYFFKLSIKIRKIFKARFITDF